MMRKNEKTSTFARIALGATAVLALAGHANAAVSTCTNAAATIFNTVNNPGATGSSDACVCAEGYVKADGTSAAGDTTLTCVRCADGYYVSTIGGTSPATANGVCTKIPKDHYVVKNAGVTGMLASVATAEVPLACPAGSEVVWPTQKGIALADCTVKAGYYLHTGSSLVASVVIHQTSANFYSTGGVSVTSGTATDAIAATSLTFVNVGAGSTANVSPCPFGGSSAAGSTAQTDCTPDCSTSNPDSSAIAVSGECWCKSGYYGTPVDYYAGSDFAAKSGCTACQASFSDTVVAGSIGTYPLKAGTGVGDCVVAPGHILTQVHGTSINYLATAKAPANTYASGGTQLTTSTTSIDSYTYCPKFSTSAAGSGAITDCKCVAGYSSTSNSCEYCPGQAAGTAVGTHTTCAATTASATPGAPGAAATPAASAASSVSVFAAVAAVAAAQLVL